MLSLCQTFIKFWWKVETLMLCSPGFPPIRKQFDQTLEHKGLWFQADHTLDNI